MEKNDIIENTGHDAKGAKGFDYQFLYFINRLLKMAIKETTFPTKSMMMFLCPQKKALYISS